MSALLSIEVPVRVTDDMIFFLLSQLDTSLEKMHYKNFTTSYVNVWSRLNDEKLKNYGGLYTQFYIYGRGSMNLLDS
jgi:hypothetical protein